MQDQDNTQTISPIPTPRVRFFITLLARNQFYL